MIRSKRAERDRSIARSSDNFAVPSGSRLLSSENPDTFTRTCKRRLNVPALGRLKRTAPGVVCHCSWVEVACLGLA